MSGEAMGKIAESLAAMQHYRDKVLNAHPLWGTLLNLENALTAGSIALLAASLTFIADKASASTSQTSDVLAQGVSLLHLVAWVAWAAIGIFLLVAGLVTAHDIAIWRAARRYTRPELIALMQANPDFANWAQTRTNFDGTCFVVDFGIIRPQTSREWMRLAIAAVRYSELQVAKRRGPRKPSKMDVLWLLVPLMLWHMMHVLSAARPWLRNRNHTCC